MFIAKLDCYIAGEFFPTARVLIGYFQIARNLLTTTIAMHCGGKNRRHLRCRNIMRSRGSAVKNKGSSLNFNINIIVRVYFHLKKKS